MRLTGTMEILLQRAFRLCWVSSWLTHKNSTMSALDKETYLDQSGKGHALSWVCPGSRQEKTMSDANAHRLLAIADRAYRPDLYPLTDEVPLGDRGDTLADFIALEIRDVTKCCKNFPEAKANALKAISTAIQELSAVEAALEEAEAAE